MYNRNIKKTLSRLGIEPTLGKKTPDLTTRPRQHLEYYCIKLHLRIFLLHKLGIRGHL